MIFIPRQNLVLDMLASLVPTRGPLQFVLQIKGREVCLEKGTKCFGGIDLNEREVCPAIPPPARRQIFGGFRLVQQRFQLSIFRSLSGERWTKHGENFIRVGDPRVQKFRLVGFAFELGHSAREAKPVQQFMMAAIFGLSQIGIAPRLPIARAERFKIAPVRLHVRIHAPMLLG